MKYYHHEGIDFFIGAPEDFSGSLPEKWQTVIESPKQISTWCTFSGKGHGTNAVIGAAWFPYTKEIEFWVEFDKDASLNDVEDMKRILTIWRQEAAQAGMMETSDVIDRYLSARFIQKQYGQQKGEMMENLFAEDQ